MNRITVLMIAVGALSAATVAFASPGPAPSSYLPLEVGNRWTYVLTDGEPGGLTGSASRRHEVRVGGTRRIAGRDVFLVENYLFRFVPADVEFFNDKLGHTVETRVDEDSDGAPRTGSWYPWSDPDAGVALPEFVLDCFHGSAGTFYPGDPTHSVPAGTFGNVLTIEYTEHPCQDGGVLSESFAFGIGLIERRISTFAGVETWVLEHAVLGGLSVPATGRPAVAGSPPLDRGAGERSWGAIKSTFVR
jgi:hypothetical protein